MHQDDPSTCPALGGMSVSANTTWIKCMYNLHQKYIYYPSAYTKLKGGGIKLKKLVNYMNELVEV